MELIKKLPVQKRGGFLSEKTKPNALSHFRSGNFQDGLPKPGKYKAGKRCLYIKRLGHIHVDVLELLIRKAVKSVKSK
jgi:hypothetical protein